MDRSIVIPLHALLDTRDAPTVLVDANYRIVAANKAYCESYGVEPDEVVGRTCHEVSHRSSVPCHEHGEQCPHREAFAANSPGEVLHTHYDFQGQPDYVRIQAHPLHDADGNVYMMESLQRLLPRKELDGRAYRLTGKSPAFVRFLAELAKAAKTGVTVWLHGESGTGKELAARFVHENSPRRSAAFVAFNCAAHTAGQIESELFGLGSGSRHPVRRSVFGQAQSGTLFLDEFDSLPLFLQGKLLRVLDSGDCRPFGSPIMRACDARLIVASRNDLGRMASEGAFRQDLFYRVAGFRVRVPALRERREDIPLIAESLLAQIAHEAGIECRLTRSAMDALAAHDLPGNMRELYSLLLGATTRCAQGVIEADDIVPRPPGGGDHSHEAPPSAKAPGIGAAVRRPGLPHAPIDEAALRDPARDQAEAEAIRALLRRYGSRRIVAKKLGISVPVLYRKLKQLGIINLGLACVFVQAAFQLPPPGF